MRFFHDVGRTVESTVLCIRFPFLYPRNRFTGKHYNDYNLDMKIKKIHDEGVESLKFDRCRDDYAFFPKWKSWTFKAAYDVLQAWRFMKSAFHIIPTYNELYMMEDGWRKAFGIQMCREIKSELLRAGGRKMLMHYRIFDIKEKYGALRWDDNGAPFGVHKVIAKYEYISERTCAVCGRPADGCTPLEYWRCPYCYEHRPKDSKYFLEFGLENNPSWYGYSGYVNSGDCHEAKKNSEEYHNLEI